MDHGSQLEKAENKIHNWSGVDSENCLHLEDLMKLEVIVEQIVGQVGGE